MKKKRPATGAIATNLHQGSRSETLADYLFSAWGTVTPARRQDDHGVDLYCTLTDVVGQRAFVSSYYSAQVKSDVSAWVFDGAASVKWLIEYPTPMFLVCVDKKKGQLLVYHTLPRFMARFYPPTRLTLTPGKVRLGQPVAWKGGRKFSLSAPILRVETTDLGDAIKLAQLKRVLEFWVDVDRRNGDLLRTGLLRFRMPAQYRTNEIPADTGMVEQGSVAPTQKGLEAALLALVDAADCVGHQLQVQGDRAGALFAAMLIRYFFQSRGAIFAQDGRWPTGATMFLREIAAAAALASGEERKYVFETIDKIMAGVAADPLVMKFCG